MQGAEPPAVVAVSARPAGPCHSVPVLFERLVFRLRAQVVVVVLGSVVVSPTAATAAVTTAATAAVTAAVTAAASAAVTAATAALLVGEGRVISVVCRARSQHRRERVVRCGGL